MVGVAGVGRTHAMLMLACAIVALATAYGACLASILAASRRRPLGLSACLAAALLICAEAVLLHGLSLVHAVGRTGLFAGQAAIVAVGLATSWRRRREVAERFRHSLAPDPSFAWVVGLGVLALGSALAYRPNNSDSMNYHLARVAYWLQNRSVPVRTRVARTPYSVTARGGSTRADGAADPR